MEVPILKIKKLRPREVRRLEGRWKDDRMEGKENQKLENTGVIQP